MQRTSFRHALLLSTLTVALLAAPLAEATMVLKMDLEELCQRSNLIYRGRVVDVDIGSMRIAGGKLPTVTYTLDVSEALAGDREAFLKKGGQVLAQVTMVAGKPEGVAKGRIARFSKLPAMPDLRLGEEYLLITTAPGPSGLSTTVGLGQGSFHIYGRDEMAANELGNAGLSATINGPVTYSQLAAEIRALIGQ